MFISVYFMIASPSIIIANVIKSFLHAYVAYVLQYLLLLRWKKKPHTQIIPLLVYFQLHLFLFSFLYSHIFRNFKVFHTLNSVQQMPYFHMKSLLQPGTETKHRTFFPPGGCLTAKQKFQKVSGITSVIPIEFLYRYINLQTQFSRLFVKPTVSTRIHCRHHLNTKPGKY